MPATSAWYEDPEIWKAVWGAIQDSKNPDGIKMVQTPEEKAAAEWKLGMMGYDPYRHFASEFAYQNLAGMSGFTPQVNYKSDYMKDQPFMGGYQAPKIDFSSMPAYWRQFVGPDGKSPLIGGGAAPQPLAPHSNAPGPTNSLGALAANTNAHSVDGQPLDANQINDYREMRNGSRTEFGPGTKGVQGFEQNLQRDMSNWTPHDPWSEGLNYNFQGGPSSPPPPNTSNGGGGSTVSTPNSPTISDGNWWTRFWENHPGAGTGAARAIGTGVGSLFGAPGAGGMVGGKVGDYFGNRYHADPLPPGQGLPGGAPGALPNIDGAVGNSGMNTSWYTAPWSYGSPGGYSPWNPEATPSNYNG